MDITHWKKKRIYKKMGYYEDQSGIMRRYVREEGRWDSHLNNTKKYILSSAKRHKNNTAIVLGSGWCLDVPFAELAQIFKKVVLVDISHPPQIRHKARKYKNIVLEEVDLTGDVALQVFNLKDEGFSAQAMQNVNFHCNNFGLGRKYNPDFVVSVNLLNQLDNLITDFISRYKNISTEDYSNFRKRIQTAHISALPLGKSCLITDRVEQNFNDDGKLIREFDLLYTPLPKGKNKDNWIWDFDLSKTFHNDCKTRFGVIAMEF